MSYRFALIGCGRIAQRHASLIAQFGKLIAVCDSDTQKQQALASQYNCAGYDSAAALLAAAHPDVVVICSPNGLHCEHAIESLSAGCHVLCEKPMAINVPDCERMLRAAELANKRLFVVKQNRYNPPVVFVKKLLDNEKLGKIFSFQLNCFWNRPGEYYQNPWRGTLALDGGILYTQFSHFLDLLYWYFGELDQVSGVRNNFCHRKVIEFEDTGAAIMKMKSGIVGAFHYTINAFRGNMEGSLTIFGEKGTVKIGGAYLDKLEYFQVEDEMPQTLPPSNPANEYGGYQGSMSNHAMVYQDMIAALSNNEGSIVEAREAMQSVAMIDLIYRFSPFNDPL